MPRRLALAAFSLTFLLSACGRQVTGIAVPGASPTPNALSGEMEIKFRTFGAMDFNNVNYMIVFNTSGTGGEPYADAFATTFCNYSFAFAIGPTYGTANAALYQIFIPPGSTKPAFNQLTLAPGTTSLVLNPGGLQTEFDLIFARSQLNIPSPVNGPANPCVTATAASSPTPNSSATPSASTTATNTAQTWYMNLFTTNTAGVPLDAMGFGVTDTSFVESIDTTQNLDQTISRQPGAQQPPAQSEYISGFEIINSP